MKNTAFLITLVLAAPALAATPGKSLFFHDDWIVACDNTRTCRAAGYQVEGDEQAVSVLLERKAGPREPVTGRVQLGSYDEDGGEGALPERLQMRIGARDLGPVVLGKDMAGDLSRAQTEALVSALTGNDKLAWSGGGRTWTVSGKGAAAVLLRMDDIQGRIGTPGAALRKGGKSEAGVLLPLPLPVVRAATVPDAAPRVLGPEAARALLASLRQAAGDDCDRLTEAKEEPELTIWPLAAGKQLVSTGCWMGAYNVGEGYWVTNVKPPYAPVLVTASGSDYEKGTISAGHKGRGLGDCWGLDEWVWDGRRFVHTASATTGLCRLVAAGGAWHLPTLVTEVRR